MDWTTEDHPSAQPITVYEFLWNRYREVGALGYVVRELLCGHFWGPLTELELWGRVFRGKPKP